MALRGWRLVGCVVGLVVSGASAGASLQAVVADPAGRPVEDAVVFLEPLAGRSPGLRARNVVIEQKDRRFVQPVTVVQAGQPIAFPNLDTVRHHVYSLSQAKLFEIKLYAGVPAHPVVFDKPGTVVLGCNIHDGMSAFVRVVDTPWFGKTDAAGRARIEGLPDGEYRLKVWNPGQPATDVVHEQVLRLAGDASLAIRLDGRGGGR